MRLLHKCAGVSIAGEISIAGESRYSESVPERIVASQCDVLLSDSPRATLAQVLVDELCVKAPQAQIGLFGMDEAPDSFLSAVHLGVRGYVLKDASSAEIIAAVRAVVIVDHICGRLIPNA